MKLVFTFFLVIFCYLPGRCDFTAGSSRPAEQLTLQAQKVSTPRVDCGVSIHGHVVSSATISGDNPQLVGIEEDSESDLKKHISRYVSIVSHIFFSGRLSSASNFLSQYRYLCYYASCKYITQRVLRI